MRRDIGLAVAYKKLCDAGLISDHQSTKTISDMYGVTRRRVQNWMKEYGYSKPRINSLMPQVRRNALDGSRTLSRISRRAISSGAALQTMHGRMGRRAGIQVRSADGTMSGENVVRQTGGTAGDRRLLRENGPIKPMPGSTPNYDRRGGPAPHLRASTLISGRSRTLTRRRAAAGLWLRRA